MFKLFSRTTQSLSKQSDSLNSCFFFFFWLSILSRKTLNLVVCAYFKAYDQKNIRRRVYDALNVLMAMNIISKEKKEIKWVGLPTNSAQECQQLEVCVEELTLSLILVFWTCLHTVKKITRLLCKPQKLFKQSFASWATMHAVRIFILWFWQK